MSGLGVPHNLRLGQAQNDDEPEQAGATVIDLAEAKANTQKILEIEHPDGSITISMDGKTLGDEPDQNPPGWWDNLAENNRIPESELNLIADDLLRGIADDMQSRTEWIEARTTGMKLLGLKIEVPNLGSSVDGAPVEGMSRVRHPLLLEAVLRFQANARGELLPVDGPVKIRNDDNNAELREDQLANALERDLNHYLTSTASEYYPDTDRMLLMLGFGGTAFKKVYYCPLRNRPVSETVDADDLIVNNAATDLKNAKRITHRTFMKPSTVKRLQIMGVYADIDLDTARSPDLDSAQLEKKSQQGVDPDPANPDDRDREIYECYCELDVPGFEHKYKGKITGLEIPYRVTIDVSSRKVLSIVRNYDEVDNRKELPEARDVFVKYTYVPGFGFYDIGLLHILGNTTNAITAAWREMLDAGMFASFPGFLMADLGGRQNTNLFRVPPGGGALVKTGGMPINQAVMPLPYKEPGAGLMNLVTNMAETGARIGNTSELQVGEGRADIPVGTTLALIEQAQKVLNSVHKRMHTSQAQEFKLLVGCFKEHPESFWQQNRKPATKWDEATFMEAVNNFELVPQADPNTASQTQRLMKVMALKQLQQANPGLYDPIAIDTAALTSLGWSNPMQFMAPASVQGQPPPELIALQAKAQATKTTADAKMQEVQQKGALEKERMEIDKMKALSDHQIAQTHMQMDKMKMENDTALDREHMQADKAKVIMQGKANYDTAVRQDRAQRSHERMDLVNMAATLATHPQSGGLVNRLIEPAMKDVLRGDAEEDSIRNKPTGLVPNGGG